MEKESKAIVLAADAGYLMPLSATLKSIFANGYHGTVYVMNNDIPQEWFEIVNAKLPYGNVQDIKIDENILKDGPIPVSHPQLNYMAFARIFAPELIQVDKLLYLDSDTVVDNNINNLLNFNLRGYILGATFDLLGSGFNSGMLLIDVNEWLKNDCTNKIWATINNSEINNGDQTLLNNFFVNKYLELPDKYNYQIGAEKDTYYNSITHVVPDSENIIDRLNIPQKVTVYHYITPDKPWKLTSSVSKRSLWWKYYSLDWDKLDKPVEFPKFDKKVFIFTSLAELRDIEVLIKNFSNIEFNIAAYVDMIFMLKRLLQYDNVRLYPMVVGKNIDQLIKESNAMLDITDGPDNEITKRFAKAEKPIIGFREDKFDGVIPENSNYELVHSTDEMIEKLEKLGEK